MNIQKYRDKWDRIRAGGHLSGKDELKHLCSRVALSFLDAYYYNDRFAFEYIDLLCEMATSGSEGAESTASSALFGMIIEGLCDDFEELQTEVYNRVMSRIIGFCRKLKAGAELSQSLDSFSLDSDENIYSRAEKLRMGALESKKFEDVEKIVVLSRITIGADVALTGVLAQKLLNLYPDAKLVFIGDSKLKDLFGGNDRFEFRNISYSRRGGLLERISTWHQVLELVQNENVHSANGRSIVLDTDSRLSQLGVLPVCGDSSYLFFRSRGDSDSWPKRISMAELANFWADKVLGPSPFAHPKIWIPGELAKKGQRICSSMRRNPSSRIYFVNFGVGGNLRKRIDGDFEQKLVERLLAEKNALVILDKGFGGDELERSDRLLQSLSSRSIPHLTLDFENESLSGNLSDGSNLVSHSAGIGAVASLIAACDIYVGYDSACQHIAAAAGTRTLTIFAGTNNTRFVRRWRAFGKARSDLIHVDTLSLHRHYDNSDILERVSEVIGE